LNSASTWSAWVHPWVAAKKFGYSSWVAKEPQSRQLVLGVDLIPSSLADIKDPSRWERSCAAGNFNSYAHQLGTTLVNAGLQNSVLRLGPEMNGRWENDYIGDITQEQNLWASCFAHEVTALRQVIGEHFLIDWNPNACVENIPYAHFYPGNAYVDILGLDLFDESCVAPSTPYTFQQLVNEPASLAKFEAFAAATGKPMSLPEWALSVSPVKDDPGYVNGIGSTVANGNFAFESYFDFQKPHPLLGPHTPLSLAAFQKWFGTANSRG
jgi:beta-mannanase